MKDGPTISIVCTLVALLLAYVAVYLVEAPGDPHVLIFVVRDEVVRLYHPALPLELLAPLAYLEATLRNREVALYSANVERSLRVSPLW